MAAVVEPRWARATRRQTADEIEADGLAVICRLIADANALLARIDGPVRAIPFRPGDQNVDGQSGIIRPKARIIRVSGIDAVKVAEGDTGAIVDRLHEDEV